jgi:putative phosphoesterase
MAGTLRIGILADSHGAVPDGVRAAFEGVDHIIHAGDLEDLQVLVELEMIAPVTAVRGNCDTTAALAKLPVVANVRVGETRFLVAHRERDALRAFAAATPGEVGVVVTGHTHVADIERRGGVLFINPGSTTYPRGDTEPSVMIVTIADGNVGAEVVGL